MWWWCLCWKRHFPGRSWSSHWLWWRTPAMSCSFPGWWRSSPWQVWTSLSLWWCCQGLRLSSPRWNWCCPLRRSSSTWPRVDGGERGSLEAKHRTLMQHALLWKPSWVIVTPERTRMLSVDSATPVAHNAFVELVDVGSGRPHTTHVSLWMDRGSRRWPQPIWGDWDSGVIVPSPRRHRTVEGHIVGKGGNLWWHHFLLSYCSLLPLIVGLSVRLYTVYLSVFKALNTPSISLLLHHKWGYFHLCAPHALFYFILSFIVGYNESNEWKIKPRGLRHVTFMCTVTSSLTAIFVVEHCWHVYYFHGYHTISQCLKVVPVHCTGELSCVSIDIIHSCFSFLLPAKST